MFCAVVVPAVSSQKSLSDKESNNDQISNEIAQIFSVSPRFADGGYEASSH
jgi:hypothetical protein